MTSATTGFLSSKRLGLCLMEWKATRDYFCKQMIKHTHTQTNQNLVCQFGRDDGHGLKCTGLGVPSSYVRVRWSHREEKMLASLHQRTNLVFCFWEWISMYDSLSKYSSSGDDIPGLERALKGNWINPIVSWQYPDRWSFPFSMLPHRFLQPSLKAIQVHNTSH